MGVSGADALRSNSVRHKVSGLGQLLVSRLARPFQFSDSPRSPSLSLAGIGSFLGAITTGSIWWWRCRRFLSPVGFPTDLRLLLARWIESELLVVRGLTPVSRRDWTADFSHRRVLLPTKGMQGCFFCSVERAVNYGGKVRPQPAKWTTVSHLVLQGYALGSHPTHHPWTYLLGT